MKNEYMVGDWIEIFSHYFQIMRVDGYRKNMYYCLDSILFGDRQFYDCDINPIPLSIEILRKNGWKEEVMTIGTRMIDSVFIKDDIDEYGYFPIYIKVDKDFVVFPFTDGHPSKPIAYLKYVSDLQHLLFGLGLNSEMEV